MDIGCRARITKGARYGGKTVARGALVPSYLMGEDFLITDLSEVNGEKEAFFEALNSWIPVKYLIEEPRKDQKPIWRTPDGLSNTRLYRIWCGMRNRCYNQNQKNYPLYGGRGIQVCQEWLDGFEAFYSWAITHGYRDGLTIDRKDNSKGYEPDNCRWVTQAEQIKNRRPVEEWNRPGATAAKCERS